MNGRLRAVFFDAGNTLIGIDHAFFAQLLSEQSGVKIDCSSLARAEAAARVVVSECIGGGASSESTDTRDVYMSAMFDRLPEARNWNLQQLATMQEALVERMSAPDGADRVWSQLLEGVPETLRKLRDQGYLLAVVSNSDGGIDRRLERAGLGGSFDVTIDSALVEVEKPDPKIFHIAAERLGVPIAQCAHVGDLYHVDVVGAEAAGAQGLLMDPFGDWTAYDCPRLSRIPELMDWLELWQPGQ